MDLAAERAENSRIELPASRRFHDIAEKALHGKPLIRPVVWRVWHSLATNRLEVSFAERHRTVRPSFAIGLFVSEKFSRVFRVWQDFDFLRIIEKWPN